MTTTTDTAAEHAADLEADRRYPYAEGPITEADALAAVRRTAFLDGAAWQRRQDDQRQPIAWCPVCLRPTAYRA